MLPGGGASPVAVLEAAAAESRAAAAGSSIAGAEFGLSAVRGERGRLPDGGLRCGMAWSSFDAGCSAHPLLPHEVDHAATLQALLFLRAVLSCTLPLDDIVSASDAFFVTVPQMRETLFSVLMLAMPHHARAANSCCCCVCAGERLRAWLRASLNQQALGARLIALYRQQRLLERWYTRYAPDQHLRPFLHLMGHSSCLVYQLFAARRTDTHSRLLTTLSLLSNVWTGLPPSLLRHRD